MRVMASELLNILPIVGAFLTEVVVPLGVMRDQFRCFRLLLRIVQICTMGPRNAFRFVQELRQSIIEHGVLFVTLYKDGGGVKPKFHHLLHIPENISYLNMLLSCFTTERKHRSVKSAALFTFRYYEKTLLVDLLHRHLGAMDDDSVFREEYILNSGTVHDGLRVSTRAEFPCGEIRRGDVLACANRAVLLMEHCWSHEDRIVVSGTSYIATDEPTLWRTSGGQMKFVDSSQIVAAMTWRRYDADYIRVIEPHAGLGF